MESQSETLTSLFRRYSEVMDDVGECDGIVSEENQAKIDEIKAKIKGRKDAIEHRIRATKLEIEGCVEMVGQSIQEVKFHESSLDDAEIKLMRWEELLEMAK